jgi:hypothetical protein
MSELGNRSKNEVDCMGRSRDVSSPNSEVGVNEGVVANFTEVNLKSKLQV